MSASKIVTSEMAMTSSSSRVGGMNMAFLLLILAPTLASATSQDRQGTAPESLLEARCQVAYQMFEQRVSA